MEVYIMNFIPHLPDVNRENILSTPSILRIHKVEGVFIFLPFILSESREMR